MGHFYQYSAPRINPLLGPGRKTELDFVHKKNIIAKRSIFDTVLADSMWGLGSPPLNNFALYHSPLIFPNYSQHLVVERVTRSEKVGGSHNAPRAVFWDCGKFSSSGHLLLLVFRFTRKTCKGLIENIAV